MSLTEIQILKGTIRQCQEKIKWIQSKCEHKLDYKNSRPSFSDTAYFHEYTCEKCGYVQSEFVCDAPRF